MQPQEQPPAPSARSLQIFQAGCVRTRRKSQPECGGSANSLSRRPAGGARHGGAPLLFIVGQRGWANGSTLDMLDRCSAIHRHVIELNELKDKKLFACSSAHEPCFNLLLRRMGHAAG